MRKTVEAHTDYGGGTRLGKEEIEVSNLRDAKSTIGPRVQRRQLG